MLFASVDAGRSVFVSGGSKQTLTGPLDRTGFVLMEATGFGITRERSWQDGLDLPAIRLTTQSSVLLGHQWSMNGLFLTAFLGPELLHEQLTVAGQAFAFSKPQYGVRGQVELWANPTRDTLLTTTLVAGSARANLWARGSAGYRVAGNLFLGPELTTYVTETYRETKVGGHLTGLELGLLQGRLSAGWTTSDDRRTGAPYISVAAWIRL